MITHSDFTPPPVWRRFALGACIFLIIGVFGFLQPFVTLYLAGAGLHKDQIGRVLALGTATTVLFQPLLGRLSDRYDARRPFMVLAAIGAGIAYLAFRAAGGFWAFTLLTALGVNGYQYLNSVGGVLVGRMNAGRGGGAAYARYRVWGSVGYILISIGAGLLVNHAWGGVGATASHSRTALDPLFRYGPFLFFVIALVALAVPDVPQRAQARAGDAKPVVVGVGVDNLHRFLLAFFLYQFSLYGASAFLPLYMTSLGGTPLWVTAMFATGAFSEALVMTQVGRWSDRYGRWPALATAFVVMPIRLLLYVPAMSPLWTVCVQLLHGLNFGIMGSVAIVFVNEHANETNRGALQARMAATIGLGLALGPLACGYLAQRWGLRIMFLIMSVVGMFAATLFLTLVRESHPTPEKMTSFPIWIRRENAKQTSAH